jgi:uncharacterized protein YxjI
MNFPLAYPVKMTFKLLALAPQISVRDANDMQVMYVRQKLFKLKEEINIFADDSQLRRLYGIKADRILDWSARYNIANDIGQYLGAVKRHGARSLWKASYDVLNGDQIEFHIREENAFVRLMDTLFGAVPILGMFSGYVFNPVYLVRRGSVIGEPGPLVMQMVKKPSFMERNFYVEKVAPGLTAREEERLLLSLFMVTLLERARG